jgi:hypothetical protein
MEPYEWMKFYEAAVLETDCLSLPSRIEAAQNAIGQRVIKINLEDSEAGRLFARSTHYQYSSETRIEIPYAISVKMPTIS